jgi:hypothetical protein
VKRKIKKAYCPPEVVEKNPIMDYAKHIIFGYYGKMSVNSQTVSGLFSVMLWWCSGAQTADFLLFRSILLCVRVCVCFFFFAIERLSPELYIVVCRNQAAHLLETLYMFFFSSLTA